MCAAARIGLAHGTPTPLAQGSLQVRGSILVDSTGQYIPLRGVKVPGLNLANPTADQIGAIDKITFGTLRLRWNLNAVRLPVSATIWRRDGQGYLDRVAAVVQAANNAGLVVVLANFEDDASLPTPATIAFWTIWAAQFKDAPMVIFDVFNQPSTLDVPGHLPNQRSASDWQFWLQGGVSSTGQAVVGMQALVDAIRAVGAAQVIAVSAFNDPLDFQGFGPEFFVRDANVIYEVHPFFDHAVTDEERDRNFGFLARIVPVYAGEWGLRITEDSPACRAAPSDPQAATDLLFRTLAYFDSRAISWTAFSFEPRSLIRSTALLDPTQLDRPWTCGIVSDPEPGMGEVLLLWLTGDPAGFGTLAADQTANAAGGPTGPVAPGELINFFGFLFGPANDTPAAFDPSGALPHTVADVRILFDGESAPLLFAGPFLVTAQVPYSVAGKNHTSIQLFYRDIPSNTIALDVSPAAPGIFTTMGGSDAIVLNHDGGRNSSANPALASSVVTLYATGYGLASPPEVTGRPAPLPPPVPVLPVSLFIGSSPAELLFAGEAPGFVGLLQLNARIPATLASARPRSLQLVLTVGAQTSLTSPTIWVQ